MTATPPSPRPWAPLLIRLAVGAAGAAALRGGSALFGLHLPWAMTAALGLAGGALWWIVGADLDRAVPVEAPALDLDADYALPHSQDNRVRRLEDLAHGAQPNRRMTGRGLVRVLGEIAEERARDPQAPDLDPHLLAEIAAARAPHCEKRPVGPMDRRTLHRRLRELAPREERDR